MVKQRKESTISSNKLDKFLERLVHSKESTASEINKKNIIVNGNKKLNAKYGSKSCRTCTKTVESKIEGAKSVGLLSFREINSAIKITRIIMLINWTNL